MRFALLACALAGLTLDASAVYYGQPREELIKELGKPNSELRRGGREVLLYKTGRIELELGKVAVVQGIAVAEGPGGAPAEVAALPATESAPQATAPLSPSAADQKVTGEKSAEQQMIDADVVARTKIEKEIELLSAPPVPQEPHDTVHKRWLPFAVELLIKGLMMLAALKLTTKYWSIEISWRGLVIAAAADTAARAIVGTAALWALGIGSTLYADEAVGALVLMTVLRKVSYNQSLQQAVTITITSKTFSIVVGSFLSVFITRLLFGGDGGGLMPF